MKQLSIGSGFALRGTVLDEARRAACRSAAIATSLLLAMIFAGSGGLRHIDLALLGYLCAVIASFAITAYRVALFWRRPPSAYFGRLLAEAMRDRGEWMVLVKGLAGKLFAQNFIRARDVNLWRGHLLLAFGTLTGFAVTLPLVFGWLRFEAVGDRDYRALLFSVPTITFSVDGVVGWMIFHTLILSGFAVLGGGAVLVWRRLRADSDSARMGFHALPLLLLTAVAVTGLALPVVAAFAPFGWFGAAAWVHELSVIALLIALPFSKLFHLFIRPLHLGVQVERARNPMAVCPRCGDQVSATSDQIRAIRGTLQGNGLLLGERLALCPPCRRRELASAHNRSLNGAFQLR